MEIQIVIYLIVCVIIGIVLIYLFIQSGKEPEIDNTVFDRDGVWDWVKGPEANMFKDKSNKNSASKNSNRKNKAHSNQGKRNTEPFAALGSLIAQVMSADGSLTREERDAVTEYLASHMNGSFLDVLDKIGDKPFYNQNVIEASARCVKDYYKNKNGGLYFVAECLYSVVTVNGITPNEWLAMCSVLDILFVNNSDFINFINKYESYETGSRPYCEIYYRRLGNNKTYQYNGKGTEQTNGKNRKKEEKEQSYKTKPTTVNKSNYAILGLKETASKEEIRKRYHELAKQYHPDTTLDEMEKNLLAVKFVEIQKAYKALING